MRIIKNRKLIRNRWRLDSGGGDGRVILPLARFRELRAASSAARAGLLLAPEDEVASLAEAELAAADLIALEFGSFNEGRGYSQAVELRRRGFRGEIRALGAHRDNLPLMERCGIDAYQLADGEDPEAALAAFSEITAYYPLNGNAPPRAE